MSSKPQKIENNIGTDFVICLLCGQHMRQITNTHLRYRHKTTTKKYKQMFSTAEIICVELKSIRATNSSRQCGKGIKKCFAKLQALQDTIPKLQAKKDLDLTEEPETKVICRLCGKPFQRIHWTHLITAHDTSPSVYRKNFPDAPIESKIFRKKVSKTLSELANTNPEFYERLLKQGFSGKSKEQRHIGAVNAYKATVKKYGINTVTQWGTNALRKYSSKNPVAEHLRRKYTYDNQTFRSTEEIVCYKFLKELGVPFKFEYSVGNKLIDFFIGDRIFWEHHPPHGLENRTFEEYSRQRREALDKNGFKDFPLIITKSLKELQNVKILIQGVR